MARKLRRSLLAFACVCASLAVRADMPLRTWHWDYAGRATDDGDLGPVSIWVNANGDFGFTGHVSNHSVWCHTYKYSFQILTTDNVVLFETQSDQPKLCGHHDETDARAGGNDRVLRDNFNALGSANLVMFEDP